MAIPALVFDASAIMALFLQEKEGLQIEKSLHTVLQNNGQIFVPSLFWYETGNTLLTALNRERITKDEIMGIEIDLAELPIVTDPVPGAAVRQRIMDISIDKKLTFYDASYVELAFRLQLDLVSLDKKVIAALKGRSE